MSAGTIALTNNSDTVTGTGTAFTTDLKPNDFIIVIVGGVTYTLAVKAIASATSLTLVTAYGGPTASGNAWTAVPNATLVGITAQVASDVAKAIRGLNLDKANWQQVFSGTGNITVNLPDGSSFTGPAWNSITTALSSKADLVSGAVPIAQGGTGAKTKADAWTALATYGTTAGTAAQGNDSRLTTVNAKSGGVVTSALTVAGSLATSGGSVTVDGRVTAGNGDVTNTLTFISPDASFNSYLQYYLASGSYHCTRIVQNGTATFVARSSGACYAASFNPTSDSRLKFNKSFIDNALSKMLTLRGMTYDLNGSRKAGVIAQDARKVLPETVSETGDPLSLSDGTIIEDPLAMDYTGLTALNVEATKELVKLLRFSLEDPASAKEKLDILIAGFNLSNDDLNESSEEVESNLLNPPKNEKYEASKTASDARLRG
ncbi:tail fiber domain-containing protein [Hafnia psychrotolerans]|uniref:Peptidase S74 domain-containing protein n=1 Tax=Hafnia psychrotolerans TaxID=1477018 RepID=A0ABQ1GSK3_9GAMM|nr:hypothetical protein GCM10011328_26060 [Hafnia psychrotolerans]